MKRLLKRRETKAQRVVGGSIIGITDICGVRRRLQGFWTAGNS